MVALRQVKLLTQMFPYLKCFSELQTTILEINGTSQMFTVSLTPFRRYSSVPFPVSKHVRQKGVRLLVQRHDVLGDALTEQQLVLPPPTGRLPGHQALRHVMPPRTDNLQTRGRCHKLEPRS